MSSVESMRLVIPGGRGTPWAPAGRLTCLQIEGSASVNGVELDERDALEIVEEDVVVKPSATSHLLLIEMAKAAEAGAGQAAARSFARPRLSPGAPAGTAPRGRP